jgi:prepilin-type N-terminal cleavage/methylation domain-containing protein
MKQNRSNPKLRLQHGFSLVETMVVVALLLLVLGVATDGLIQMQKRTSADTGKVDTTQMSRQFLDQIVNDLHQSGYPSGKMFDPNSPPPLGQDSIAQGLLSVDSNAIDFEADVDGSGLVSHVYLELIDSNGAVATATSTCPCTLRRGTVWKKDHVGAAGVPYYTEVNNVTNINIFSAYQFDGQQITLPALDLQNIKTIKITVNVQSTVPDADGNYPTITMASEAKISNN